MSFARSVFKKYASWVIVIARPLFAESKCQVKDIGRAFRLRKRDWRISPVILQSVAKDFSMIFFNAFSIPNGVIIFLYFFLLFTFIRLIILSAYSQVWASGRSKAAPLEHIFIVEESRSRIAFNINIANGANVVYLTITQRYHAII